MTLQVRAAVAADSADPEIFVTEYDGQILAFPWIALLEIAAVALAKAMGAKLGENLGQAVFDALIGKNNGDREFQREVTVRLARIEEKLDATLDFLRKELPEVVGGVIGHEFTKRDMLALTNKRIEIDGIISALPPNGKPNDVQLQQLVQISREAYGLAVLAMQSKAGYLGGVHALAVCLSGFSRAARVDKNWLSTLRTWGTALSELAQPFVDETNPVSFPAIRKRLAQEKQEADAFYARLPMRVLNRITQIPIGGIQTYIYYVWFVPTPTGVDHAYDYRNPPMAPILVHDIPLTPLEKMDLAAIAKRFNLSIEPWWQVRPLPGQVNRHPLTDAEDSYPIASRLAHVSRTWQPKIDELDAAVMTLRRFLESCAQLRNLVP